MIDKVLEIFLLIFAMGTLLIGILLFWNIWKSIREKSPAKLGELISGFITYLRK